MEINPYASPLAASEIVRRQASVEAVLVDGRDLVVYSGTRLAPFCVVTNEAVADEDMRTKQYVWCPPWVLALILLNVLILLIGYLATRKKCVLTFGLHPDVRRKRRNRLFVKLAVVLLFAGLIAVAVAFDNSDLIAVAGVLFGVALIVALIGNAPLRVVKHDNGRFWIRGCSAEFLRRAASAADDYAS
jgi:hypothetical protein